MWPFMPIATCTASGRLCNLRREVKPAVCRPSPFCAGSPVKNPVKRPAKTTAEPSPQTNIHAPCRRIERRQGAFFRALPLCASFSCIISCCRCMTHKQAVRFLYIFNENQALFCEFSPFFLFILFKKMNVRKAVIHF